MMDTGTPTFKCPKPRICYTYLLIWLYLAWTMVDAGTVVTSDSTALHSVTTTSVAADTSTSISSSMPAPLKCRDRMGYFTPDDFGIHTCSWCLLYLVPNRTWPYISYTVPSTGFTVLYHIDNKTLVIPNPQNETSLDVTCSALSSELCADWKKCCKAAVQCCDRQQAVATSSSSFSSSLSPSSSSSMGWGTNTSLRSQCPMTWDGYSCVDFTPAGETAVILCPAFLKNRFHTDTEETATRQCTANGTWFVNTNGKEWTDYHYCQNKKTVDYRVTLTLRLSLKGASLALLIPSIAIFLMFRQLRNQVRIKLHINLFIALALTSLLSLIWEAIITNDLLVMAHPENYIRDHQGPCKFLNIMTRCTLMMTFTWMFCEGFYLTWLMLQSFRHITTMIYFHLFGWGVPVFFSLIYVIVRATKYDDDCWILDAGKLEWIIDGPTVACMAMNFFFLIAIMRVMVRQLRSHQEEQSMLKRGLRALLILIPLFGLQQFCIIYRPQPDDPGFFAYDVASAIIMNLQGAVVALIFCFFNGEVQTQLKQLLLRLKCKLGKTTESQPSMSSAPSTARLWRPSLASIDTTASIILANTSAGRRHSHYESGDNSDNENGKGRDEGVGDVKETIVEDDKESEASGDSDTNDSGDLGFGQKYDREEGKNQDCSMRMSSRERRKGVVNGVVVGKGSGEFDEQNVLGTTSGRAGESQLGLTLDRGQMSGRTDDSGNLNGDIDCVEKVGSDGLTDKRYAAEIVHPGSYASGLNVAGSTAVEAEHEKFTRSISAPASDSQLSRCEKQGNSDNRGSKERAQFFISDEVLKADKGDGGKRSDFLSLKSLARMIPSTKNSRQSYSVSGRRTPTIVVSEEQTPTVKIRRNHKVAPSSDNSIELMQVDTSPPDPNHLAVPKTNLTPCCGPGLQAMRKNRKQTPVQHVTSKLYSSECASRYLGSGGDREQDVSQSTGGSDSDSDSFTDLTFSSSVETAHPNLSSQNCQTETACVDDMSERKYEKNTVEENGYGHIECADKPKDNRESENSLKPEQCCDKNTHKGEHFTNKKVTQGKEHTDKEENACRAEDSAVCLTSCEDSDYALTADDEMGYGHTFLNAAFEHD